MTDHISDVVVCAGGLGTRAAPWTQHIPKEFQPVDGRPGILHLLDELTALAPARVVVVYHPFYEPFIAWAQKTLTRGAQATYQRAAHLPRTDLPLREQLDLRFIPQRGAYADITSVLNGIDHLQTTGPVTVAFADNLYPSDNPSRTLATVPPGQTAVLVRPYDPQESTRRGVIIADDDSTAPIILDLVEKPTADRARELEDQHGSGRLWLLEGRARLSNHFLDHLRGTPTQPNGEPSSPSRSAATPPHTLCDWSPPPHQSQTWARPVDDALRH
ncbi:sugar phosphate nucleotidyltransferase [Promicromonospora soli]